MHFGVHHDVFKLLLYFTCNTADHRNAKEEANNLLLDTKKTLNEQLQGAESETKQLKVGAQLTVRWDASACI